MFTLHYSIAMYESSYEDGHVWNFTEDFMSISGQIVRR